MIGLDLAWCPDVLPNNPSAAQKVNPRKLGQVAEVVGDHLLLKTLHGSSVILTSLFALRLGWVWDLFWLPTF